MKVLIFLVLVGAWYPLCAEAAERHEASHVVCLSHTDQVTLSLTVPDTQDPNAPVIIVHGDREVLQWISLCIIDIHPTYEKRVRWRCDSTSRQLTLTLTNLTPADSGTLQCKDSGLVGRVLPGCLSTLEVIALEDLSKVCSYSSGNRTVFCEPISEEVKVYRMGQMSDRDLFYFSEPFHYILGRREYGQFAVARTRWSREDELCSYNFTFHVESQTRSSVEETPAGMDMFTVIYIAGIVLVLVAWATLIVVL